MISIGAVVGSMFKKNSLLPKSRVIGLERSNSIEKLEVEVPAVRMHVLRTSSAGVDRDSFVWEKERVPEAMTFEACVVPAPSSDLICNFSVEKLS